MKTKQIHLFLLIALYTICGHSQSIEKFSIDSGGGSATVSGIQILYSIGEVNVQELSAEGISISEGFINSDIAGSILSTVDNQIATNQIKIFPVPTNSELTIQFSSSFSKNTLYSIYNPLGKTVLKGVLNSDKTNVNIIELSSGIYFIKIKNEVFKFFKSD